MQTHLMPRVLSVRIRVRYMVRLLVFFIHCGRLVVGAQEETRTW